MNSPANNNNGKTFQVTLTDDELADLLAATERAIALDARAAPGFRDFTPLLVRASVVAEKLISAYKRG